MPPRCGRTANRCVDRLDGLGKPDRDGWRSRKCPLHPNGKPLRVKAGDYAHIVYNCRDGAADSDVFDALVKEGIPPGCLAKPKDAGTRPKQDTIPADTIWAIVTDDEATSAERLVWIAVAIMGEIPEKAMVEWLAVELGFKKSLVYRATGKLRRRAS